MTNADYGLWLATGPSTSGQPSVCSWNANFAPQQLAGSDNCPLVEYDPVNKPTHPVTCVDWCDARAYCAWAGKRLCGRVGGGTLATSETNDSTRSEWQNVCSLGGTRVLPYGNTFVSMRCKGADVGGASPVPVSSMPLCVGGFNFIYDMSGNVAEWEASCSGSAGASDLCTTRGGHSLSLEFPTSHETLLCDGRSAGAPTPGTPATRRRDARTYYRGFRCCADAI